MKHSYRRRVGLSVVGCFVSVAGTSALGAERHWVGPINGLWSDPNNWSATPGGPGGAGVPQPGDAAAALSGISARFDYAYTGPAGIGPNFYSPTFIRQDVPASAFVADAMDLPFLQLSGSGQGDYLQTAGTATINTVLRLGHGFPDGADYRGHYTLSGNATLNIGTNLSISNGTFTQTDGVCTIGHSALVGGTKPGGIAMSGGTLNIARGVTILNGSSTFSGGHTSVGSSLFVSGGTVTVTGGTVAATNLTVSFGLNRFILSGGAVIASHTRLDGGEFYYNGGALSTGTLVFDEGHLIMSHGGDKLLRTRGVAFIDTGKLHLADNAITVDYAPGDSQLTSVRTAIVNGNNNGSWNGVGIVSSLANTTTRGVGYAEASSLDSIPPIFGDVDDTTVLVRLTRYGDADLNGFVNLSDFNRLAANFGQSFGAVWSQGDFNYDGRVNLSDFNLLASNFGLAASGPSITPQDWSALASAVPEPSAATGLVGMGIGATLRPRARRGKFRILPLNPAYRLPYYSGVVRPPSDADSGRWPARRDVPGKAFPGLGARRRAVEGEDSAAMHRRGDLHTKARVPVRDVSRESRTRPTVTLEAKPATAWQGHEPRLPCGALARRNGGDPVTNSDCTRGLL